MTSISGCNISEVVYEGRKNGSSIGASRTDDSRPVILKTFNSDQPTAHEMSRMKHEYAIMRQVAAEGVCTPYALEPSPHGPVLVLEDIQGHSLKQIAASRKLSLTQVLKIGIQLAHTLSILHQQHIVHKDIKPSNIIMNPATGQVQIIDFGIASFLPEEHISLHAPSLLEGTLAYMSPEQTGRTNRAVDYRTDMYSLGVTLYQLLTGQLPFQATDPVELVHGHLAKIPTPPHALNPDIPQAVVDIVMKCLAKTPEARYQSAEGLRTDLESCLEQWERTGTISLFIPGQQDIARQFVIPQKLYGREAEIEQLMAALERVSERKGAELFLISGYAGVGKSMLARELQQPVIARHGYFLEGKYEQFKRNIPYAGLIEAFQHFVRQIMTESDERIAAWKANILRAVGANGRVLTEVIPDLTYILGDQPAIPELPSAEAQHRFNWVLQQFVNTCASPDHPLCLFLDDLHWADLPSLKLLELLAVNPDMTGLLLIGAYRDHEVSADHPFLLMQKEIQKAGRTIQCVTLAPLEKTSVNLLLADTLKCELEQSASLAEICLQKTRGNPFFLKQFLHSLVKEHLIAFDEPRNAWRWDIEAIRSQESAENVAAWMANSIQKLPGHTQHILTLAACIGSQFDLHTLSVVNETPPAATAAQLWNALQEGLIIPLDASYKYVEPEHGDSNLECPRSTFRFLHDRVQQAAYTLIPEARKHAIHLKIGRLLLQNISKTKEPALSEVEGPERIFELANHFNAAIALLLSEPERVQVARLNLLAGKKAKASAAYQPALEYLQTGIDLLEDTHWNTQYELTLALYTETADAACLCAQFEVMEHLIEEVLRHGRTLLDTVKAHEIRINGCIARNELAEAVKTGLAVLKQLGVVLPENPRTGYILLEFVKLRARLAATRLENLQRLPEMRDPVALASMRILLTLYAPATLSTPNLFPLIVMKQLRLSIASGNTAISAVAYASYGVILRSVFGNIETSYRFGQLGLHVLDQCNVRDSLPQVCLAVNGFLRHWKEHPKEVLKPLLEGYHNTLNTGKVEFASYVAYQYCITAYFIGSDLTNLEKRFASYHDTMSRLGQQPMLQSYRIYRQAILNLRGAHEPPWCLTGQVYNEEEIQSVSESSTVTFFAFYFNKLMLSYLFGNFHQVSEYARLTERYKGGTGFASIKFHLVYFYESLALLALYPLVSKPKQRRVRRQVARNQRKLKKWARHAFMNFQHKWLLVEAERARVSGRAQEARAQYEQAIALAREHEYLNDEAVACETAGKFYLSQGAFQRAQKLLREARYAYQQWGALAKVNAIEKAHPWIMFQQTDALHLRQVDATFPTTSTQRNMLDTLSILKASQAISSEIVLENLLKRIMQIVIENAGAQRGVLLLEHDGELRIAAEGKTDGEVRSLPTPGPSQEGKSIPTPGPSQEGKSIPTPSPSQEGKSIPTPSSSQEGNVALPLSLIRYVRRRQETIVLHDAAYQGQFRNDDYITAQQTKSVLCLPVLRQQKLIGILYLENNAAPGVFTAERVDVLQFLSSQIAISVENARLYAGIKHEITERKQAEEERMKLETQLRQSQKMQAVGTLAGGIAHDFNNILSTILGYTDLLLRRIPGTSNDREFLECIHRAGKRAADLVAQVLTFSRSHEHALIPIRIGPIIKEAVRMLRSTIPAQIEIRQHIAQDCRPILADATQIHQMIVNLCINASHAMQENGGVLEISLEEVNRQGQSCLQLTVRDTGCGMSPDVQERIFEPFFTTKEPGAGTGLGLSVVHGIVARHHGEISVESEPGKGAAFLIMFPTTEQSILRKEHRPAGSVKTGSERILIVDDEHDLTELFALALRQLGYQIITCNSAQEALEAFREHPGQFDLVLTDQAMPGMTGVQLSRELLRINPDIPIILATGYSETVSAQQAKTLGIRQFLKKPVEIDALARLIRHILDASSPAESEPATSDATEQPLIIPPQEELAALYDLLNMGDLDRFQEYAQQLQSQDDAYTPFIRKICQLAHELRVKELWEFWEQYKQ